MNRSIAQFSGGIMQGDGKNIFKKLRHEIIILI
jgi:hypothetical protein